MINAKAKRYTVVPAKQVNRPSISIRNCLVVTSFYIDLDGYWDDDRSTDEIDDVDFYLLTFSKVAGHDAMSSVMHALQYVKDRCPFLFLKLKILLYTILAKLYTVLLYYIVLYRLKSYQYSHNNIRDLLLV